MLFDAVYKECTLAVRDARLQTDTALNGGNCRIGFRVDDRNRTAVAIDHIDVSGHRLPDNLVRIRCRRNLLDWLERMQIEGNGPACLSVVSVAPAGEMAIPCVPPAKVPIWPITWARFSSTTVT